MKKFFLTSKWNGVSFESCVEEAEVVGMEKMNVMGMQVELYDLKTKNNIVFEGVNASRVFATEEEALGSLGKED